ncbi:MAG: hypothetical protein ACJAVK_001302 [Akkermansiaceae bacterium]|jgi:hypothetical protein
MSSKISPLALPFELASQPTSFLAQIRASAEDEIRADIRAAGTKPLGVALAGAKFVMDAGGLTVVFPGGIPRGARLMKDKVGKHLPKLVDGKSGRILKCARVSKGAKAAKMGASAALVVVQAAHMISGHDNAKQLQNIEKAVAKLLHGQQTEMKARVEAIYRYAKEIAGPGSGKLTKADQNELGRLCLDLMQLRAQWREDFIFELNQIDPAKSDILTLNRKASYQKNLVKRAEHAESLLEAVQWMHFTLLLQMTLSAHAGRADRFLSVTLADEAASWRSLSDLASKRALEISGKKALPENWDNVLDHLDGLASIWDLDDLISIPR